jgi:HlyD family secretion protein
MDAKPQHDARDLDALHIADRERSDTSGRNRRLWLFVAVAASLLAGAVALAFRSSKPEVQVATARSATGSEPAVLLNASGYVTPRRRATVAAKITARVMDVLAEEGMHVQEGQVLAQLDDADARNRLAAAQASLAAARANIPVLEVSEANAERELQRQQSLQESGAASMQALDQARAARDGFAAQRHAAAEQVRVAQANVALAQQELDNCTVRAPFAGVVVSKDAQPGEMVSPISAGGYTRTGIATVVDMQSLEIEVDVNEAYIAKVKPGQPVTATLDAYPSWKIPCRVRTVIPTADRQKATVKVRVAFDALDPRILPDMGVKVAFLSEATNTAATAPRVLVPRSAVRARVDKSFVFLLKDGRLERRAVKIGGERGPDVELLAGVAAGDSVVTSGPEDLHDEQAVVTKR